MSFLDTLFGSKKKTTDNGEAALPVLPSEIYESALFELQDRIAPSALKVDPEIT
jgi:hypothetical protein